MIYPRGPEFAALLLECLDGVRWALQTGNEVVLLPASGTGGLEATAVNLLRPGQRALFCTNGHFSELWASIAARCGADVVRVTARWGAAVDAGDVGRALDDDPAIDTVFVAHNETSTGVLNDVRAIAAVAKAHDCLVAVDSVCGAPCHPLPVDALGLDAVITASQKGWLAPPGLAMVALSPAAIAAAGRGECRSWYFDFSRQLTHQHQGMMQMTPPLSVMYALCEGIEMMREEGLPELWQRHELVSRTVRRGLRTIGLEPVARPGTFSRTVTAVESPWASAAELTSFLGDLRDTHGVVLADGLGALHGRSFRIGHLGPVDQHDVRQTIAALAETFARRGLWRASRVSRAAGHYAAPVAAMA
jgi:aspartate aminotransferase-like enzyme